VFKFDELFSGEMEMDERKWKAVVAYVSTYLFCRTVAEGLGDYAGFAKKAMQEDANMPRNKSTRSLKLLSFLGSGLVNGT
jgi:hypothetical protein